MTVNQGVARFQQHAYETLAQMQAILRTLQRVVGPFCRTHITFLIEAIWQRADFIRSQRKPLLRALRLRLDETLSRQRPLRLLATQARDGVYTILLQSEPFLHRIRRLCGTSAIPTSVPTLILGAFAGLALLILLLFEIGIGKQAGNELAGTVEATPTLTPVPDWTIFDDIFANEPTRLATSEFGEQVRTSGAALTADPTETSRQLMREPVPLPRPRPRVR
jgi:hypothetical protein